VAVGDGDEDLEVGLAVAVDVARHRPDVVGALGEDELAGMAVERGDQRERIVIAARHRIDPAEVDDVARGEVEDAVGRRRRRFARALVAEHVNPSPAGQIVLAEASVDEVAPRPALDDVVRASAEQAEIAVGLERPVEVQRLAELSWPPLNVIVWPAATVSSAVVMS
jgi:hypothetical protein